ncbi:MAG: hypothetical protein AAFQ62_04790 [Pseudomonadota bacterium]
MPDTSLFDVDPKALTPARALCHAAIQWPSRAARANLPATDDDGHSNLGWHQDLTALVGHPLAEAPGPQLGFRFSDHHLIWLESGAVADALDCADQTDAALTTWCNAHLAASGLRGVEHAEIPYSLDRVDFAGFVDTGVQAQSGALGAWYGAAQVALNAVVLAYRDRAVIAPSLRCWPHHFDLGVLFALDEADPEHARSVGMGLSPGDESYAEPYYYCTPWPTPELLPDAPDRMHWHREGFVSMVMPATRITADTDMAELLGTAAQVAFKALEDT